VVGTHRLNWQAGFGEGMGWRASCAEMGPTAQGSCVSGETELGVVYWVRGGGGRRGVLREAGKGVGVEEGPHAAGACKEEGS
jgi:hypothetical protein